MGSPDDDDDDDDTKKTSLHLPCIQTLKKEVNQMHYGSRASSLVRC